MNRDRRKLVGLLASSAGSALLLSPVIGQSPARRIELRAARFEFSPAMIEFELGETKILVATSVDMVHGLSVPDLSVRADLIPRRGPLDIEVQGIKAGRVTMVCLAGISTFCEFIF